MHSVRLELPTQTAAIAQARASLDELEAQLDPIALSDLRLLVSEVVTNAIRHTNAPENGRILLVVEPGRDGVRVEVHDEGPGFTAPAVPAPRATGTSGWGLFLVERLARRWGVETAPRPYVWFVLAA